MKKMNNYVAPKAEMIELYTSKDLMQSGGTIGGGQTPGQQTGSTQGSY